MPYLKNFSQYEKLAKLIISYRIGVDHDGSTVDCPDSTFIMSKATPGGKYASRWSPCSRKQIQDFLR